MNILAGGLDTGEEDQATSLPARISRYGRAKERAVAMRDYLIDHTAGLRVVLASNPHNIAVEQAAKVAVQAAGNLDGCGNYLHFRHYYTVDQVLLHAACFCKQHLICPLCAIRRGSKTLEAYLSRFQVIRQKWPELSEYLLTLTVKDGPDLPERWGHLDRSFKVLKDRRRYFLAGNRGAPWTEFAKVKGAVGSYEVKRGKGSGLWHPHVHMVGLCETAIDPISIKREWEGITGDSFMIDVRPFDRDQEPAQGFMEVFKYAVKFGDLSLADNWEVAKFLRGSRLLFSLGEFRGVKVPDKLTDEPLDELPYFDLFYRYFAGSGYSIAAPERQAGRGVP
jgi:hypothetical protein